MHKLIQTVGLVAAIVLPLWNIPLIVRIVKRKSSNDVSVSWALGVWSCLVFMAPSGFISEDPIWKVFNIMNLLLFTCVVAVILIYRNTSH